MTVDPQPGSRRLFFALWPDPRTRAALAAASRDVARDSGGRPVSPSLLHVTVVFVGQVGEAQLPAVMAAAEAVAAPPFDLLFDRVEHWRKPRVLVAVPSSPAAAAAQLAAGLAARLAEGGLSIESRPWRPHVTVARKVTGPVDGSALAPVRWPVTGLALVESLAGPDGVRYEIVRRWPLAAPGSPPDPPAPADC